MPGVSLGPCLGFVGARCGARVVSSSEPRYSPLSLADFQPSAMKPLYAWWGLRLGLGLARVRLVRASVGLRVGLSVGLRGGRRVGLRVGLRVRAAGEADLVAAHVDAVRARDVERLVAVDVDDLGPW